MDFLMNREGQGYGAIGSTAKATPPIEFMEKGAMYYLSGIDDDPQLDLEELINRVFDNYPDEFRTYWGLDADHAPEGIEPDEWERRQELDRLSRKVGALAGTLIRPKIPDAQLGRPIELREAAQHSRQFLKDLIEKLRSERSEKHDELIEILSDVRARDDVDYSFFLACLQLYLSSYLIWPRMLAERVVNLTRFAARVRGGRAIQYLGRVSRCYLYGMHAELAVMSRAVLEASLEEVITEEQVRTVRRIPSNRRVGLADYIEVARGTILSDDAAEAASKLKQDGDDAIHLSAESVGDPNAVLENLVVVLRTLEDHRRNER